MKRSKALDFALVFITNLTCWCNAVARGGGHFLTLERG